MSFVAVSAGVAGVGAIGKIITGLHQNHLANQINPQFTQYNPSPFAGQKLALSQNMFNGQMPGVQNFNNNIAAGQANYGAAIGRNATDGSQALSLGGLALGEANNQSNDLQSKEAAYKLQTANNLSGAYDTEISEGDKVYQSMLQKYMIDLQQKAQLRGSGFQDIFGGISDIASGGLQFANAMGGSGTSSSASGGMGGGGGIDLNAITGGLGGNKSTLNQGNPFNQFVNPTTYGE